MTVEATSKRRRDSFLTIELLLSIGLAAVAFGSFLSYYDSVRRQQIELKHLAAATLVLQSKMEQIRLGDYGSSLNALGWIESEESGLTFFRTAPQRVNDLFSWQVTTTNRPEAGTLLSFKTHVFWREGGRRQQVSAATQLLLQ